MPRKPRNPGSGKAPQNGPAQGPGWGGAAKGDGRKSPGKLPPGAAVKAGCSVPGVHNFVPTYKGLADKERIEALKELQWDIAFTSKFEGNRLTAAQHLLERLDGKATQRTELTGAGGAPLTLAQLVAESMKPKDDAGTAG